MLAVLLSVVSVGLFSAHIHDLLQDDSRGSAHHERIAKRDQSWDQR